MSTTSSRGTDRTPMPSPSHPTRTGRHLPGALYGILVVAAFAGVIGASAGAGIWQTSGRTTAGGGSVTLSGTSTTEIKGWMAVGDVAYAFDIPLPEILAAFALDPGTNPKAPLNTLETDLFSVTALRDWIEVREAPAP